MKTDEKLSLPTETLRPVERRHFLKLTAIILLILGGVNAWSIGFLKEHTLNTGYLLTRKKWEMLLNRKAPVDWLILGDSSGNAAVMPEVLQQKLGVTSLNLCTVGWLSVLNDAWMLETYLKRFGPPKGVVLVHGPESWSYGAHPALLAQVPLAWGFWERLDPPLSLGRLKTLQVFLDRYFPLYSRKETLSDIFQFRWGSVVRNFPMQADGFMVHSPNPDRVEESGKDLLGSLRNRTFRLSQDNEKALEKLIHLTRQYRFHLYLANGPIHESLYEDPNFKNYFSGMQQTLANLARSNPQLHYNPAPALFSKAEMESADHLTPRTAKIYSESLSDWIARTS